MSNINSDTSDIQQAAEQVDPQQIEKNLNENKKAGTPEVLSEKEDTPFINEELRTDK